MLIFLLTVGLQRVPGQKLMLFSMTAFLLTELLFIFIHFVEYSCSIVHVTKLVASSYFLQQKNRNI